jgi:predicted transcriptional regulator
MSDKEMVLEAIQRLPKAATMRQIRERIEFLAAVKEGEDSLDRGEAVPHGEVERRFATWAKKWRSKSSGRNRHSTTSRA